MNVRAIAFLKISLLFALAAAGISLAASSARAYPVTFTDSAGNAVTVLKRPERVVCLVPGITEILFEIGASDAVRGITYHTDYPREASKKEIVGGFFSPSIEEIERIAPDMIFVSGLHGAVAKRFAGPGCLVIRLESRSIAEACGHIRLLGDIFDRREKADAVVGRMTGQLKIVAEKVAGIPGTDRKRVVRLMGYNPVTVPGDDSFQNEFISAAGGIPPRWNRQGNIVPVTVQEWVQFNPQVIYGCGGDAKAALRFLGRPGWGDVEAVRKGAVFDFPCNLTCRASIHSGGFVSWLAAKVYDKAFSEKGGQVLAEAAFDSRPLHVGLGYVRDARVVSSHIHDFVNKSLVIDFTEPLSILSTLEGPRDGILTIGNHYTPPPCWGIDHEQRLDAKLRRICRVVGKSAETTSFLYTGADMDHLAVGRERYRDMEVVVAATAGVASNAVRMTGDEGRFYEPGTVNLIVLPNMKLTPRAMSRAVISATEAKTAALADLDIRSSETPRRFQATGTGTDNMIVVSGTGIRVDNAGGHSKMGELIARAVYAAVQEAVSRQNGIVTDRSVFQRLKERKITVFGLISENECECGIVKSDLMAPLEKVLMDPRYAGFLETAMALSDAYESGLVADVSGFESGCRAVAEEISGKRIGRMIDLVAYENMPRVMDAALNALLNGVYYRMLK